MHCSCNLLRLLVRPVVDVNRQFRRSQTATSRSYQILARKVAAIAFTQNYSKAELRPHPLKISQCYCSFASHQCRLYDKIKLKSHLLPTSLRCASQYQLEKFDLPSNQPYVIKNCTHSFSSSKPTHSYAMLRSKTLPVIGSVRFACSSPKIEYEYAKGHIMRGSSVRRSYTSESNRFTDQDKETKLSPTEPAAAASDYGFSAVSRLLNWILPSQMISADKKHLDEKATSPKQAVVPDFEERPEKPIAKPKAKDVKPVVPRPTRESLNSRTRSLVKKLKISKSASSKLLRTEDLNKHLLEFPEMKGLAAQEGALQCLLKQMFSSRDDAIKSSSREGLALLGYTQPPRGKGIRILSIDGGGTRGMMALEILEQVERDCGKRIHELFDVVVGCSTGAIILALLIGYRVTVSQARDLYREISTRLFSKRSIAGVTSLFWSHSYYSTSTWVAMLKESLGEKRLLDTVREQHNCAKMCVVSCIVNKPRLEAYIFRNYQHWSGRESVFPGSAKYRMWEALQASAAAPGYFEEVPLDTWLHQDGGVFVNNPCGVGLHESRLLWPDEQIQCVFSIGNGRSALEIPKQAASHSPKVSSLKEKIIKIVDSATDTEMVHTLLSDLVPDRRYFRLNPYISHPYTLDETDPDKIAQMQQDAALYVRKNKHKLIDAANLLLEDRTVSQKVKDWWTRQRLVRFNWLKL